METELPKRNAGGRPPGSKYPRRLLVYTTERGMEQLQEIADRWETSQADVVRRLIREAHGSLPKRGLLADQSEPEP